MRTRASRATTRSAAPTAATPELRPGALSTQHPVHGAAIPSFDGDRCAVRLSAPSPVRTPRLQLAPVTSHDLEELFALHADPRAFAQDLTEPLTELAQMRWVLGQWTESWQRHGTGYLTVRARGTEMRPDPPEDLPSGLLGVVGLTPLEFEGREVLSAYWRLAPAATGRGVATEAMRAVLAHPRLGALEHEVFAVTAAGNAPSLTLAERLGFVPVPSDHEVPGGRPGDVLLVRRARHEQL